MPSSSPSSTVAEAGDIPHNNHPRPLHPSYTADAPAPTDARFAGGRAMLQEQQRAQGLRPPGHKRGRTLEGERYVSRGEDGRAKSLEYLQPSFDHPSRQAPLAVCILNVIATVVGGGTLSLPYAMAKCGLLLGSLLLITSALASYFALYVLVSCSRRTGKRSYQAIARYCFGPRVETMVLVLLFFFLFLVLMAFQVLTMDTITDLVEFASGATLSEGHRRLVLTGTLWLAFPLCLAKSMYALRYSCYLGFASVVVLTASIVARSLQLNLADPSRLSQSLRLGPESWFDVLLVAPIFVLAFMCSFNILPVHESLISPTRDRMRLVLSVSGACTLGMYLAIAAFGYMYALDGTMDNILGNFPSSDGLLVLGRAGLGATLFFSLPILILPMREVCIELLEKLYRWADRLPLLQPLLHPARRPFPSSFPNTTAAASAPFPPMTGIGYALGAQGPRLVVVGEGVGEEEEDDRGEEGGGERQPLLVAGAGGGGQPPPPPAASAVGSAAAVGAAKPEPVFYASTGRNQPLLPPQVMPPAPTVVGGGVGPTVDTEDYEISSASLERAEALDLLRHFIVTLFLLMAGYRAAAAVPGVSFIWSLCGSSLGIFLCLSLPAAFYLKVRHRKRHLPNKMACYLILGLSAVAMVLCTGAAVIDIFAGDGQG